MRIYRITTNLRTFDLEANYIADARRTAIDLLLVEGESLLDVAFISDPTFCSHCGASA